MEYREYPDFLCRHKFNVDQLLINLPLNPAFSIHLAYLGLRDALRQITRPPGCKIMVTIRMLQASSSHTSHWIAFPVSSKKTHFLSILTFTWSFKAAHNTSMSSCSSQSTWSINITCRLQKPVQLTNCDMPRTSQERKCTHLPLKILIEHWHTFVYMRFLNSSTNAVVRMSRRSSLAKSTCNHSKVKDVLDTFIINNTKPKVAL